ncbi:MAG: hypothetical protein U1F43_17655 [Myxococcota bacterium]
MHDLVSLERFFAALAEATWLGLATEANAMHAYRPRVCLVQVAVGRDAQAELFAIDPLAFAAVRPHPLAALGERLRPSRSCSSTAASTPSPGSGATSTWRSPAIA